MVRDILTELDGAVAWGGDFDVPQESHFEVALGPTHPKVRGVARKLRAWRDTPGRGRGRSTPSSRSAVRASRRSGAVAVRARHGSRRRHASPVKEPPFRIGVHRDDSGVADPARGIQDEEAGSGSRAGPIDPPLQASHKRLHSTFQWNNPPRRENAFHA